VRTRRAPSERAAERAKSAHATAGRRLRRRDGCYRALVAYIWEGSRRQAIDCASAMPPTAVVIAVAFQRKEGIDGALGAIARCDAVRHLVAQGGASTDSTPRDAIYTIPAMLRCTLDGETIILCFECLTMGAARSRLLAARDALGQLGDDIDIVFDRRRIGRLLAHRGASVETAATIARRVAVLRRIDRHRVAVGSSPTIADQARADILAACARLLAIPLPEEGWKSRLASMLAAMAVERV
jgi:hypothetical protein